MWVILVDVSLMYRTHCTRRFAPSTGSRTTHYRYVSLTARFIQASVDQRVPVMYKQRYFGWTSIETYATTRNTVRPDCEPAQPEEHARQWEKFTWYIRCLLFVCHGLKFYHLNVIVVGIYCCCFIVWCLSWHGTASCQCWIKELLTYLLTYTSWNLA